MHGIGFLPWYPFAGGKQLKADHPFAQALARIAVRHSAPAGAALAGLAAATVASDAADSGTSKIEHLEENVAATGLKLSDEECTEIDAIVS